MKILSRRATVGVLETILLGCLFGTTQWTLAQPLIFPEPQELESLRDRFSLNPSIPILVAQDPAGEDLSLARFLMAELSDRYGLALEIRRTSTLPASGPFILMGSPSSLLVREYLSQHGFKNQVNVPEGYWLSVDSRAVVIAGAEWPDTYCPLAPGVYPLLFDVLDETINVMKPKMVHIGHDEWRMPLGICSRCKGQDPGQLFARDVNKIYDYLHQRKIRTIIEASLTSADVPGVNLAMLQSGRITSGNLVFELTPARGNRVITVDRTNEVSPAIRIGEDVSSLIFLHASEKPARNIFAYAGTWNFADTADLLGWYEVVYADGFIQTVPVRYGVNILESSWGNGHVPKNLAYEAEGVECSRNDKDRIAFFAYEWLNPRLGIPIREFRLRGCSKFINAAGKPASPNRVLLAAISLVKKRSSPEPGQFKLGD